MGSIHWISHFHKWDSLRGYQAHRRHKLCDRFSSSFCPNESPAFRNLFVFFARILIVSDFFFLVGINPYVIAFTALAGGTSWPDLVASKIAAERQVTADSAIANITCRFHSPHIDVAIDLI